MATCAEQLQDWHSRALRLEEEVGKAILGQQETIRLINESVREAMLNPRFARRKRAPTDFAWVAASFALFALFVGFGHRPLRRLSSRRLSSKISAFPKSN
jgi:hypothetical protein